MASDTDRIEKKVLLKAARERVWRAISDSREFGTWFGAALDGPFVAGTDMTGRIAPTKVDPEVARLQQPHEGRTFTISVGRIEPMRLFSFRWHPGAIDPNVDYSNEPTTLVEFVLEEVPGGTMLTVTESGFDRIPLERRTKAFAGNDAGWSHQVNLIEKYLALAA